MSSLWQLTEDMERLETLLLMSMDDGEVDAELAAQLDGLESALEDKADAYAAVLRKLNAHAKMYRAEEARWREAAQRQSNAAARLKERLREAMVRLDARKLGPFTLAANGGKQSVRITAPVPPQYCKQEPDTSLIREALEKGIPLEFASFEERGNHLRINP